MLKIADLTKFTFQDFPNKTACIIWFSGCNFRCPYCHNPEFIKDNIKYLSEEYIFNFLNSRINLLDGVVISGGECLLSNEIYNFILKIKKMGFLIKIDSNGTNNTLIKKLINNKLIDYFAIDYKAPKYKFNSITKTNLFDKFENSLKFLINSNIDMEIRTTVHTDLLDENDINNIIIDLEKKKYTKNYYIQNFRNDNNKLLENMPNQTRLLDKSLIKKKNFNIFYRNFF